MSHKQNETVSCKWSPPIHFCRFAFVAFVITSVVIHVVAYRRSVLVLSSKRSIKLPRHAESEQLVTNSENVGWVNVGPEMWVYSAYLDTRADNAYFEKWGVVVVAVQKIQTNQPSLYCLLTDNKGRTLCLKQPIRRVLVYNNVDFKHHPYYYVCNLPSNFSIVTLKFVSFSFNSSCQQPSPPIPVTQVQNTSNATKRFGVCIESPLFNMKDVQFIIQTIEMNRILGAEWFTFYVHSASQDVIQVLQDYSKEGVVEVVMSTIPNINVHYYGQRALIQDCAYRNMYKVKYLLFTDLDEIIVPQKHRNWSELLTAMDKKSFGEFHIRHVTFVGKSIPETLSICNSNKEIERPRFMKFTERSSPYPLPKRAKLIIKPETFEKIITHGPCQLLKGYSTYRVPSDVALLYHYRLGSDDSRKTVKDDRMVRYFHELIDRIEEHIC